MTLGEFIINYRNEHGYSQRSFASRCGVSNAYISMLEKGENPKTQEPITPSFAQLRKIALGMGMSVQDLLAKVDDTYIDISGLPSNIVPLPPMGSVPLIGQIACGTPILAEQNIEDYVDLPAHIRADFALTCKGDSMIGAGVHDGDMVYIRQQPEVSNGQIAAVIVDEGEATLKRFYHDGSTVSLVAENPTIAPLVFSGEDVSRLRVIGLAVAFTHPLVQ